MTRKNVRYAVDAILWTVTHIDDFLWAMIYGFWAYYLGHPERPVYERLKRLLAGERPADIRVRDLPRGGRYVVLSDHHLLYTQAPHDYFGSPEAEPVFLNERIYAQMATRYGAGGWTLVENGDVEDLLVPEPAFDRSDCLRTGILSRLHLGWDVALRLEIRRRQLVRIVLTYDGYYRHLLRSFGADRIVKLIGNHDTELLRPEFAELVPLGVPIEEFAIIAGGAAGEPPVVVCHGHQMDAWTCTASAAAIGESITESFAWAGQGADRIWERADWAPPRSRSNALVSFGFGEWRGWTPKLHHMSETRMMEGLATLGEARPWLILGHTHEPRYKRDLRYVNTASAGRYQDIVWATEVEDGVPRLVAWWVDQGRLLRSVLAERGDLLDFGPPEDLGALEPLPYEPQRPATLAEIRAKVDAVAPRRPRSAAWFVWRILLNVPVPLLIFGPLVWGAWALVRWLVGC